VGGDRTVWVQKRRWGCPQATLRSWQEAPGIRIRPRWPSFAPGSHREAIRRPVDFEPALPGPAVGMDQRMGPACARQPSSARPSGPTSRRI